MKKTTKIFGLLLTLFGLALVTGCTPITDTPEVPGETTYTVTIASGIKNGTVSTDKTSAKAGETVKLTVTPNDGYKLENLIVVDSSANPIPTTSNTFTMPESNVTVDATFSEIPKVEYTVTYSSEYGTAPASITVPENTVLTAEQLPELSTEGKTFGGWFDGEIKVEAGYKVIKDVTLTAKWDEITTDEPVEQPTDETPEETPSEGTEEPLEEEPENVPTTASYTVKHLQQNLDNDEYTEVNSDRQTLEGIIGAQTAAVAKAYTGFTAQDISQQTINADGNTVVEIRYNRNKYKVIYPGFRDDDISVESSERTYKYGATIETKIDVNDVAYVEYSSSSNTMGTSDITLTNPELWFKAETPVEFYYGTNQLSWEDEREKLGDYHIDIPASKDIIKSYFKLVEDDSPFGDGYYLDLGSTDNFIPVERVQYKGNKLRIYF